MKRWVCIVLLLGIGGCTSESERTTITFWHFWSEPAQTQALERLVAAYEQQHPAVDIQLTPLSWSDGKSKLQLAFNAGTQPDIVHVGLDWFGEFDASGVFAPFTANSMIAGRGALWVLNARALVRWTGGPTTFSWGLARSDAHNVLKRCLPILWEAGASNFYTRSPIHLDMDSSLVSALMALRDTVAKGAVLEPSRSLDERFLRGEIRQLYTGSWIMDMARDRGVTEFSVVPGRSILNGDVLTITQGSSVKDSAATFVRWLTTYEQAARFCHDVADAGFPADDAVFEDSTFQTDPIQQGFLRTAQRSVPLPASPLILEIEPIIEELIERSYRAASPQEFMELVATARLSVQQLEEPQP